MSFVEIIVVVAAGCFLLWLWRGGGQSRVAAAPGACAGPRCRCSRGVGCFGVLGALLLAGMIVAFELATHRLGLLAPLLAAGIVACAFIGRWGFIGAFFGMLMIAVLATFALVFLRLTVPRVVRQIDAHGDVVVADWLDGPAADWDPFTRHHRTRAAEQAVREAAARHRAELRSRIDVKRREVEARLGRRGIGGDPASNDGGVSATLEIRLKPDAFDKEKVTPEVLAASILTMVDLLTARPDPAAAIVDLTALNNLEIRLHNGRSVPVHEVAHLVRRSRLGASAKSIERIEIVTSSKSRRHERQQLDALTDVLLGVRRERSATGGRSNFSVSTGENKVAVMLAPVAAEGIPVEQELAAARSPAEPAEPAEPVEPAEPAQAFAKAPAVAPAAAIAPLPPAPPTAEGAAAAEPATVPHVQLPAERTAWSDTLLAYHLLMWMLPESLGGVAQVQTPAPNSAQAPAVEVAAVTVEQPAERSAPDVAAPGVPEKPPREPAAEQQNNDQAASTPAASSGGRRPEWLDWKLARLDDRGTYYMRRTTGRFFDSPEESREAVDEVLLETTDEYVKRVLGAEAASRVHFPTEFIRANFVESMYDEHGPVPGLPDESAWETHVLMKFDWVDRELVERAWRQSVVAHNLRYTGAGTALVLALLGTVFGYLKLDTATRGFYSGRLKLAAGTMLVAITTLGILLVAGSVTL